jgi:hypothetical protein
VYYGRPYKFCGILNISLVLLIAARNSGIMQATLTDNGGRYEFVREHERTEEVWQVSVQVEVDDQSEGIRRYEGWFSE